MKKKSLEKIFTSDVISVSPHTSVSEAISLMEGNRISCMVVVEDGKPAGIFTERDFVQAVYRGNHADTLEIRELMTSPVITADIDTNIYEAYSILEANKIRHLVIVEANGELAGLVTQSDIMKSLGAEYFVEIKSVSKIMTKNVVTVQKDFRLIDAVSLMAKYSISCIVVEEGRRPLGVLTERDVVRLFREGEDKVDTRIGGVMSSPVRTISSEASVHEAAMVMSREKIRRLVAVDPEGLIAGLVTQHDIVRQIEDRYIEFLKEIIRGKEEVLQRTKKILSEKIVLENILRSSSDLAIVAVDLNFNVVYFNPFAEKIFGCRAEEVVGRPITGLDSGEKPYSFGFQKALEKVQEEDEYTYTIELKKEEGVHYISSKVACIRDNNSHLVGFVLMSQDITDRKRLEDEFLKAQKLESIGVLAGGIAHDFNNLLTGILNCVSLAKSNLDSKEKVLESLAMAEKASRLAKDLTQQLFTFAKIGEPVRTPMPLDRLIRDSMGYSPEDLNSKYELSIAPDLWQVEVDEGQIKRVVHNLVLNAREAMPRGGMIMIRAENTMVSTKDSLPMKEGRYVKVSIVDQGIGVPQGHLQKIFDPYFTTKKRGSRKGTGLGLAICYSIVKNHDGHITVESELGVGTTFCIYLPASHALF
ncbi:MAG TPA: CBS domain-containing protein [Dissulfurispiraceae bacterium]